MGRLGDPKYGVVCNYNDPAYFRGISRLITTIFRIYTGKLTEGDEVLRGTEHK